MAKLSTFEKYYSTTLFGVHDAFGKGLSLAKYKDEIKKNRWKLAKKLSL